MQGRNTTAFDDQEAGESAFDGDEAALACSSRWWSLSAGGLTLSLLAPGMVPLVGLLGASLTLYSAWPLLQESGFAMQERRFDCAMLSAGAVVGGLLTHHPLLAALVACGHHTVQFVHHRQVLVATPAQDEASSIYIVRCWCVGQTAKGESELRYVLEASDGSYRAGFTDLEALRQCLLERLKTHGSETATVM